MALNYEQFAQQATAPKPSMFNFQPKQQEEDKNISSEEAKQLFSGKPPQERKMIYEKLKGNGYSFEDEAKQSAPQVQTQPAPQESGMMNSIGQFGKNLSAGIASGASQAVGGTLGIVGDFLSAPFSEDVSIGGIFTGENKGGLGQLARDETARQQQAGAQAFGADTESMGYKGGKFTTGLGLSVATPGGVMGLAGKGAGLATRAGLGAVQGGIETGKFLGLTEGRLGTGGELATGAAFGGALPVVGAGLGKARDFITTKLPESLIATGIATPTKLLNASERLNKLGDESFKDATSASKWLLKNKITGDIEQRTAQLEALATKGRETAQNLLKWSKVVVADDIVTQAKAGLASLRPKLENAGLGKYTSMIDDFTNKQVWTAEDLNKARTFMADKGGIFKHSGDWVDSLQKENLQDIWKAASQYLDNAIPWFRAGNKDYEVASALAEAIKLKSAQDQARQVFSLVNVAGAGLGGIAGGLTGNDPMSVLQNAAVGAGLGLAGRAIFSPSNMSKLAVKLSEYAPKSEATKATKAIELFVKSRGENPLPQSVMNLISKANKTLWNPFKDISFIKKLGSGQVQGLSPEASNIMKWVKTPKEAVARAKKAGVEKEIVKYYSTRMTSDEIDALEKLVSKKVLPPVEKSGTVKPVTPKTQKVDDEVSDIFISRINAHNSYERNYSDISALWKISDILKDKQFESIKDMRINIGWVWKDTMAGYKPSKKEIFINKDILKFWTEKDLKDAITEEAIHALRDSKWRSMKYTTDYLEQDFEKSAKKWVKYFWK